MSGIFLCKKKLGITIELIDSEFEKLGYKKGFHFSSEIWNITVFPKNNFEIKNYYIENGNTIFCVGTFGYKGKVYNQALPLVLKDVLNDNVDQETFWGSYIIVVVTDRLTMLKDETDLSRLYYNTSEDIISTSFAGLIATSTKKLTVNNQAILELLMTGMLTSNETILSDVKIVNRHFSLTSIQIQYMKSKRHNIQRDRRGAIQQQKGIIKKYYDRVINDWFKYMPDSVIDIGMTSGIDSRLNVIAASQHTEKIQLHTHWRKNYNQDKDFKYAHIFSKMSGYPINTKQVVEPLDMSSFQFKENLSAAYSLSDGVIRPGCYWDEAYNTIYYRSNLTPKTHLRLLGFGGEQYRNRERLSNNITMSIEKWVKWVLIFQFAGGHFKQGYDNNILIKRISENIKSMFGVKKFPIGLGNFKKFIRDVESPSYRSLQAMMENRLGFCVNPFLDANLSIPSQNAVPFLGKSLSFQIDIINSMSTKLSKISNGYGYSFINGEPIQEKIKAVFWQLIPAEIKYKLYNKYKNSFFTNYFDELISIHPFVKYLVAEVEVLKLPIDLEQHLKIRSRSRLVINLGYFLIHNKNKLIY